MPDPIEGDEQAAPVERRDVREDVLKTEESIRLALVFTHDSIPCYCIRP